MELDLNEIAVFVKVVESGSFTQAARQLGMPNSTVSAKVSSLEARLGLTLIQRTTRKLAVTPAGKVFFERCTAGLDAILSAQSEISSEQSEPQGLLRITASKDLGERLLPEVLPAFQKKFPKVRVDLLIEERTVNLVEEGVDLAIRIGNLRDSSLIAKKLGSIYFAVLASSAYLKQNGTPKSPKDLEKHTCIQFSPLGADSWTLAKGKTTLKVPLKQQVVCNDLNVVKSLVLAGSGIALMPTYLCVQELQTGKVQRVLTDWAGHAREVHFVYPAQKFVHPKLSAFIQFATEPLKEVLKSGSSL